MRSGLIRRDLLELLQPLRVTICTNPIQAMFIAIVGVIFMYKLHFYMERRFKIDDAVGAVAVHGYAGFFGVVIAGFMLWGYPSSPDTSFAVINPIGSSSVRSLCLEFWDSSQATSFRRF